MPAVTIGRGGVSANGHAPDDYWIDEDAYLAVQRAILLVVAEAGLLQWSRPMVVGCEPGRS